MGKLDRFVIIGNGVAGTTAAEQIKKQLPSAHVTLIGAEPYPLYNRVALPPFLKGQVKEEKVLMRTPETHEDKGIDLLLRTRVTSLQADERVVVTEDGNVYPYDKLLVATGGRANGLDAPGATGTKHIYSFQTMDDTKEIVHKAEQSTRAAVVGGSFIAYELAEGFRSRGLETVWIMRGPRFLRRILDEAGGELVDQIAKDHGVTMIYGEEISEVKTNGGEVAAVVTTAEVQVDVDMVGIGLGLTLNTELLHDSGVELGKGIITDAGMRTNHPDIFAAGDVAEFFEPSVGLNLTMGTWNNSISHGKIAGSNMMGGDESYDSVPTYTSGLFSSKIAVMGMTPEISPDVEGVSKVDYEEKTYKRLFFLGHRLVGAVLIGDVRSRRDLLKLIRSGDPVEQPETILHAP